MREGKERKKLVYDINGVEEKLIGRERERKEGNGELEGKTIKKSGRYYLMFKIKEK